MWLEAGFTATNFPSTSISTRPAETALHPEEIDKSEAQAELQAGEKMFQLRTEWIPSVWHFENYPNALSRAPFAQYFLNSGIVSLSVMIGNVVFCTLAGYGLAKFRFPGSGLVLILITLTATGLTCATKLHPLWLLGGGLLLGLVFT